MKSYLQKHDKISYSDHWFTPKEIYDVYVNLKGYYDPCPLMANDFDFNIELPYNLFINPPYSDIAKWVDYAIDNHKYCLAFGNNKNIVILIPSRTDTKYFHKLLEYGCDLEFIKGRLKFGGAKTGAPFPSVLVHLKGSVLIESSNND